MSEAIYKATNTAILNQIGQPPPSAVLAALVESLGDQPDVVGAIVDWQGPTVWNIFAVKGGIVVHVHGEKEGPDWYGGGMHDRPDQPARVIATTRRISDIQSIRASNVEAQKSFEGFDRSMTACWTFRFPDGDVLVIDEHASRYGDQLREVTAHLRGQYRHA